MTDEKIIKAITACEIDRDCSRCPYNDNETLDTSCFSKLFKDIFDLINCQQAEIEKLQNKVESLAEILYGTIRIRRNEVRIEAIKEFADKILNEIQDAIISNDEAIKEREEKHNANRYEDNFCSMCDGKISALGGIRYFINNLVKEMVGEE